MCERILTEQLVLKSEDNDGDDDLLNLRKNLWRGVHRRNNLRRSVSLAETTQRESYERW